MPYFETKKDWCDMPFRLIEHLDRVQNELGVLGMALLGGIVRVMNRPKCECVERPGVFASLVTSVFAGLIMIHILEDCAIKHSYKGAIIGLTGWLSTEILDIFKRFLINLIKKIGKRMDVK